MADVKSAVADIKRYDASADETLVAAVFKGLGPAVQNKDASLVSCADQKELDRVRDNFLINKLGMSDGPELDTAILEVCETMKADARKSRVTFYYLLTKKFGKESVYA